MGEHCFIVWESVVPLSLYLEQIYTAPFTVFRADTEISELLELKSKF